LSQELGIKKNRIITEGETANDQILLEKVETIKMETESQNVFCNVYIMEYKSLISSLTPDENEVEEF